jgi:NADPH:quinone reductase-like Zn-dependent oxidoreductase
LPKYGPKDLLIKVIYAAQNPTDWKHVHFGLAKPGSIVGCDFAGEIVEVGKEAVGQYINILGPFFTETSSTL